MENMAPGYRFYPTEEELVSFYLHNKLEGEREDHMNRVIPVVDIYDYNPWDLPQVSGEASLRDTEQWFFFIPRQESEARGGRPKRLTNTGYWKATGSPNHVYSSDNRIIGMKRTMVFYSGRAPNGKKTDWKMNEYKAIKGDASTSSTQIPTLRQEFSLCRVYKKSKCLRAFDRRPPPRREREVLGGPCIQQAQGEEGNFTSASFQSLLTASKVERGSSPESSSSGDMNHGGQPSHGGGEGSSSHQMDVDNVFDWEVVDWFLEPDKA